MKYVAYYRVSTDKQARSGLGLEAQTATVESFVACDMPEANELTLHIYAAMAQHERKAISKRTKEALQAAKARGTVLGRQGADVAGMARVRSEQTAEFRANIYPTIKRMRDRRRYADGHC